MKEINKDTIMEQAIHNCYTELFAKAQPSLVWDDVYKAIKDGTMDKDFFRHYYMSSEEFKYIVDKYIEAYRFTPKWEDYVDTVQKYLSNGGNKDKYINEHTDENGKWHSGYRSYEEVPPLKDHIAKMLHKWMGGSSDGQCEEAAEQITDKVLELINNCKEFYKFERDHNTFSFNVYLGCGPSSNKKDVEDYWAAQGKPIQIEDRIPRLFWYYDNGYTDEELEFEFESYGPDWKQKLYEEWQDEITKEKKEQEERLAKLNAENSDN